MPDSPASPTSTGEQGSGPHRIGFAECPACGSEQAEPRFHATDPLSGLRFPLVDCSACGLTYLEQTESARSLGSFYARDYYGKRHAAFGGLAMSLRARALGSPAPGSRLLDYGCGSGEFLEATARAGWQAEGMEQSGAPILKTSGHAAHMPVHDAANLPDLEAATYDAVTMWHCLEHVENPADLLHELHRVTTPEGRILVEVPNFGGWHAALGGPDWFHLDVPRHLLHFRRDSLEKLLVECGFEPLRWSTFSAEFDAFGTLQSLLNKRCSRPNSLFQRLIGQPFENDAKDLAMSLALLLPLGIVAGAVSAVAPLFSGGGVLRVLARKG